MALQAVLKNTNFETDMAFKKAKKDQHDNQRHEWVECYDPAAEAFYYFNNFTKEHTWEKPDSYLMAADDDEMRAVICIQCAWRAKISRRKLGGKTLARQDAAAEAEEKVKAAARAKGATAAAAANAAVVAQAAVAEIGEALTATIVECKLVLKARRLEVRARARVERSRRSKERRRGYLLLDTKARRALVEDKVAHYKEAHDNTQTWEWVEALDEASQRYYYYNHYSKELHSPDPWTVPEAYVMAFEDEELRAALRIQGLYRAVPRPHEAAAMEAAIAAAEEEAEGLGRMAAAL